MSTIHHSWAHLLLPAIKDSHHQACPPRQMKANSNRQTHPPADEGSQSPPGSPSPANEVPQPPSALPGTSHEHQSLRPVSQCTTPEMQEDNRYKHGKNGDAAPSSLSSKRHKADPQPQIDSEGPNILRQSKCDQTLTKKATEKSN